MSIEPEQYLINANTHAPNSKLPVLVYRCVLPHPPTENTATVFLERNEWEKKVYVPTYFSILNLLTFWSQGTFGTVRVKHFHPNTHECYGKIRRTDLEPVGSAGYCSVVC